MSLVGQSVEKMRLRKNHTNAKKKNMWSEYLWKIFMKMSSTFFFLFMFIPKISIDTIRKGERKKSL